jgi:uncharacterized membrane protein HdeD (DUF308 family)
MRQTVKGYSLWYLVEGVLLVVTGILAMILNAFCVPPEPMCSPAVDVAKGIQALENSP